MEYLTVVEGGAEHRATWAVDKGGQSMEPHWLLIKVGRARNHTYQFRELRGNVGLSVFREPLIFLTSPVMESKIYANKLL